MREIATILLLATVLSGCVSINSGKSGSGPATYDFGYAGDVHKIPINVSVEPVGATPSLHSNRIRYRLAYDDPAQVRVYADTRWAAMPAELLTQRLREMEEPAAIRSACVLKLRLELFDHIFDSKIASNGVALLSASLVTKQGRNLVAARQFRASEAAVTADAKGGVNALGKAGSRVMEEALAWARGAAADSAACPE